ncbi:MAG: hypothetical protein GY696_16065 [Gammaproteobacteria bacterium]|nr:hypothetical protein [Gammaproteobacteria bacterium]
MKTPDVSTELLRMIEKQETRANDEAHKLKELQLAYLQYKGFMFQGIPDGHPDELLFIRGTDVYDNIYLALQHA